MSLTFETEASALEGRTQRCPGTCRLTSTCPALTEGSTVDHSCHGHLVIYSWNRNIFFHENRGGNIYRQQFVIKEGSLWNFFVIQQCLLKSVKNAYLKYSTYIFKLHPTKKTFKTTDEAFEHKEQMLFVRRGPLAYFLPAQWPWLARERWDVVVRSSTREHGTWGTSELTLMESVPHAGSLLNALEYIWWRKC